MMNSAFYSVVNAFVRALLPGLICWQHQSLGLSESKQQTCKNEYVRNTKSLNISSESYEIAFIDNEPILLYRG